MNKLVVGAGIVVAIIVLFFTSGMFLPTDVARTVQLSIVFIGPVALLLAIAGYGFVQFRKRKSRTSVLLLAGSLVLILAYVAFLVVAGDVSQGF